MKCTQRCEIYSSERRIVLYFAKLESFVSKHLPLSIPSNMKFNILSIIDCFLVENGLRCDVFQERNLNFIKIRFNVFNFFTYPAYQC